MLQVRFVRRARGRLPGLSFALLRLRWLQIAVKFSVFPHYFEDFFAPTEDFCALSRFSLYIETHYGADASVSVNPLTS